jgi:pyridoxine/pyridoxamine 5'-phosphate oxidase
MIECGQIEYDAINQVVWQRLSDAADDQTHPMRLLTLATMGEHGSPDARILVLRGADPQLHCLWFYTDARSAKAAQLEKCPQACAVGYDPRDAVQLRIRGNVKLHRDSELAERHWEQTDFHVRHAYAVPSKPGEPLSPTDPLMRLHRDQLAAGDLAPARRNFAVIELVIGEIEWLQLSDVGDRRAVMRAADGWKITALAP